MSRARLPSAPPRSALGSSGVLAPPRRADSPDPPHHTGAGCVSLHSARAPMPKPSAESARRWRLAGTRSPRWLLRCRTAPAIASVAPTLSDLHGARRTLRNMRCLLYTSDAADEEDSVDLGGRRI